MTEETQDDNTLYKDYLCLNCQTCYSIDMMTNKLCFYEIFAFHGETTYIFSFYLTGRPGFCLWSEPKNDLLLELSIHPNITPFNAKEKLLTLLTFL
jgi:hypothetical protein